ncbi:glycosyltransferase family 4 protein [Henriciella sp. AS95]|uniref:glycosyltransferase family 4 protein n=1 Tax=Henriciella sp. AS95 TaxID=3135782 RepID=UPI00316E13AE
MVNIDRIVVIHDYSEAEGGAGTLAMEAIRQYRSRGYPVTLITGELSNAPLDALGVSVVGLGSKSLLARSKLEALRNGIHNSATIRRVRAWIDENDTPGTVYHLNNWAQILSPTIYKALRPVADRTLVTCHDFFNVCPNGSFLHFDTSTTCHLKPLSAKCFFSQCDRRSALHKYWRFARHVHLNQLADFDNNPSTFAFIHKQMRDKFVRSGFEAPNTAIIPNPVSAWTSDRIRAEENSGFLFVGRVGRDKGADIALRAARDAGEKITIIGAGELTKDAAAFPNATFTGWLGPEEIADHARKARALIVPSRVTEPFGLVILEAAVSGLPVIVSDSAYLSRDVDELGFGKRVSVLDEAALVDVLKTFAREDDVIRAMSKRATEVARSLCHTPESWADAHISVFSGKLAAASARQEAIASKIGQVATADPCS